MMWSTEQLRALQKRQKRDQELDEMEGVIEELEEDAEELATKDRGKEKIGVLYQEECTEQIAGSEAIGKRLNNRLYNVLVKFVIPGQKGEVTFEVPAILDMNSSVLLKHWSIFRWKIAGAFLSPKGMTSHS